MLAFPNANEGFPELSAATSHQVTAEELVTVVDFGAEAVKDFIENKYPPLIPGVTRHATNHIVDRDNETGGVVVRYHMALVRQAWPEEAGKVTTKDAFEVTGLPGIWIYSAVVDRLRMTDDGWKLYSRVNGSTVVNKSLNPGASEAFKKNVD
ncbi:Putative NTF2-like domain superfamily protein [Colletotrichum destructivum]|uniref:NTF2-like domain superfamily protein n=1 Tax=Colletotrichum destructivum TaxID=34406 RepID=A0AAX4J2Y6_9PEZI|nr:Putative NTF2-like domain superfamily protein [Colletotrichum destructivum]